MKRNIWNICVFCICIVCLIISLYLLWHLGIFVDQFNTSPSIVLGSTFGLALLWGRIFLLFIASILSFVNLCRRT